MPGVADAGNLNGSRIMVVEDEYFLADDLGRTLANYGAEVVGPYPDSNRALVQARCGEIDAAVLDINLEGDMAFPVADALAQRGVPFVFATGYDSDIIPIRHRERPRWEKPFEAKEVAASLVALVNSRFAGCD